MSIKICLDPGHVEGANVGAAAGYREGTAMWYLAQEYAQALAARGAAFRCGGGSL